MEHRQGTRFRVAIATRLSQGERQFTGHVRDISLTGARVQAAHAPAAPSFIEVLLPAARGIVGRTWRSGLVTRHFPGGFALEWEKPMETDELLPLLNEECLDAEARQNRWRVPAAEPARWAAGVAARWRSR